MIEGTSRSLFDEYFEWVERFGCAIVSVEYRLAPETPHPGPVEDCYAGLVWTAEHASELNIDPARILVVGLSAGGGLAAATTLLARDRNHPKVAAQMLMAPMLDDRDATTSTIQNGEQGVWTRSDNRVGWGALLGGARGGADVSPYAAPARATDLSGLPPTYLDVGSAEIFRDETVEYATRLWRDGVDAELHVFAGAYHGYDAVAPHAVVSEATRQARSAWLARIFTRLEAAQEPSTRASLGMPARSA